MKCYKKSFISKTHAQMAIIRALSSKSQKRKEQRVYFCNECKNWHLTSKKKMR